MAALPSQPAVSKRKSLSREKTKLDNFKFAVCPGNNSRVLLNAFRGRPWLQTSKISKTECPGVIWEMYRNPQRYKTLKSDDTNGGGGGGKIQANICVLNHFEKDSVLVTKHGLYWSMKNYFDNINLKLPKWIPETYHIISLNQNNDQDIKFIKQWDEFIFSFKKYENEILLQKSVNELIIQNTHFPITNNNLTASSTCNNINHQEVVGGGLSGRKSLEAEDISNKRIETMDEKKLPCIYKSQSKPSSRENTNSNNSGHGSNSSSRSSSSSNRKKRRKSKSSKKLSQLNNMTNVWIAKPASLSNGGAGIKVVNSIEQVTELIEKVKNRNRSGYIIQKYIEAPLLIHGRKFDIRVFMLLKSGPQSSKLQAYFHRDGYIRTSSYAYNLSVKNMSNNQIHLTNDGVQNKGSVSGYGKYEVGNKMNYSEFQTYLDLKYPEKDRWVTEVMLPEMEQILKTTVTCIASTINPKRRRNCFELLGCDFMVTDDFELKLIEVNSNPSLEFSSPYLEELIPKIIEDSFQLTIDKFFPPPKNNTNKNNNSNSNNNNVSLTKGTLAAITQINEAKQLNGYKLIYQEEKTSSSSSKSKPKHDDDIVDDGNNDDDDDYIDDVMDNVDNELCTRVTTMKIASASEDCDDVVDFGDK